MIISIEKLRELVPSVSDMRDEELQARLEALESLIRAYTNNNFQKRGVRTIGKVENGALVMNYPYIVTGDTIQISKSQYNDGIYTLADDLQLIGDEAEILITKVVYPPDVVMGTVNMFKWNVENRDKVGIQSETISRHSVTYFNMDGDNASVGYPKSLTGFLKPYMKARF